jgi:hypothetical protein
MIFPRCGPGLIVTQDWSWCQLEWLLAAHDYLWRGDSSAGGCHRSRITDLIGGQSERFNSCPPHGAELHVDVAGLAKTPAR